MTGLAAKNSARLIMGSWSGEKKKWLFTNKNVELTNDWDATNSHKERIGI